MNSHTSSPSPLQAQSAGDVSRKTFLQCSVIQTQECIAPFCLAVCFDHVCTIKNDAFIDYLFVFVETFFGGMCAGVWGCANSSQDGEGGSWHKRLLYFI